VPAALSTVVLKGLAKDPSCRPSSAGAFAAQLRALAEGELTVLRQSKDMFHTHLNCFLPPLLICILPAVPVLIAMRWLAHRALEANLMSVWILTPAVVLTGVALLLFEFQLYKVACLLILEQAIETGEVRPALRPIVFYLVRRLPAMLRTQLRSLLDLRPASFRDNVLWPIVWVKENRSGKDAIDRSRELCRVLPEAATALMIRHYALPIIGALFFPGVIFVLAKAPGIMEDLFREPLAGTRAGWPIIFDTFMFVAFYLNIGSAFTFLYRTALRCRGEGGDIAYPASPRGRNRNESSFPFRPATLLWAAVPIAMIMAILVKAISKAIF
jgi:hypothetical protein